MNYCSTRNRALKVSAAQAIAQGISEDGGLFVPEEFPVVTYQDLCELEADDYATRAEKILSKFLSDFTREEITACVSGAYGSGKFDNNAPASLVLLNNSTYVLELWHGPTCAFKDMALQLLPHLLQVSAKKTCDGQTVVILVATSGDTGKAALEGFRDVENTRVLVFYPEDGVSPMQKRQMKTQEGANVGVCGIRGNFDDAQSGVKSIFTDPSMNRLLANNQMRFSSANSINWGRLLPQIVYYFSAYCDMMATGEMDYEGEAVNFVVPTGNFGNILAAYYAKKMGLPIHKLICASNSNNVLTDFIRTGVYNRNRPFHATMSPSMDILISSNLERLLYDLCGCDSEKVAGWMEQLRATGTYTVDQALLEQMNSLFYGGWATEEETSRAIRKVYDTEGYLCDPHTAVGVAVYEKYCQETHDLKTPTSLVSTASPFKFAGPVLQALTGEPLEGGDFDKVDALSTASGAPVPASIAALRHKEIRFSNTCEKAGMRQEVWKLLGIQP